MKVTIMVTKERSWGVNRVVARNSYLLTVMYMDGEVNSWITNEAANGFITAFDLLFSSTYRGPHTVAIEWRREVTLTPGDGLGKKLN